MRENKYILYIHIFPNEKKYIGITKQKPEKRWLNGKGYKLCPLMNKAIQKYGWESIKHQILYENLTKEEAERKEIELIAYYKTNQKEYGYNIENGGNCIGTHSEETKRKIGAKSKGRQTMLGRNITKEHIQKLYEGRIKKSEITGYYGFEGHKHTNKYKKEMSKKITGIKRSEETKKKISNCKKGNKNCVGRFMSNETRQKISNANKGRKLTKEQKENISKMLKNKKKVRQYDMQGNFIKEYQSLAQAERETGIFSQNIGKVCKNNQKYAKGFLWRYADDN